MSGAHVTVVGAVAVDVVCLADRFEPGTSSPSRNALVLGGVGHNVFAALPYPHKTFVTAVGDDALGAHVRAELARTAGPAAVRFLASGGAPTATSVTFMEQGRQLVGASDFAIAEEALTAEAIAGALVPRPGDLLVIDGNLLPGVLDAVCELAREAGLVTFFEAVSAAKAARARESIHDVQLVKADWLELTALAGDDVHGFMVARRVAHVLATRGDEGAWLFSREGSREVHFPVGERVAVADTTGAGDVLLACVVAAIAGGAPVAKAVEQAMPAVSRYLRDRHAALVGP
jgi:sugar/nucleoside kinase (ribokinase family)